MRKLLYTILLLSCSVLSYNSYADSHEDRDAKKVNRKMERILSESTENSEKAQKRFMNATPEEREVISREKEEKITRQVGRKIDIGDVNSIYEKENRPEIQETFKDVYLKKRKSTAD